MRIACLIAVCVALISTISGKENGGTRRRSEAVVYRVQPGGHGPITMEKKSSPTLPGPRVSRHLDPQKTSRRSWQFYGPVQRRGLRRSFRSRRHLRPKTIQLGRSYDITENHLETIQTPEMFEAGAIHIEPVYRVSKKKSILDELVDLMRRAINPRKSHLGPLVGPFNFPGVGDKIYVRLLEPLNTNRLVVKLVSHLPVAEVEPSFEQNNLFTTSLDGHDLVTSYIVPDSSSSSSNQRRNVHPGSNVLHGSASNHLVKIAKPLGNEKSLPIGKDLHGTWSYGSGFKHNDARYRFDQSKTTLKSFTPVQSPHHQRILKYEQGKILRQLPANGTQFQEVPLDSYPYYTAEEQDFSSSSNTLNYADTVTKDSLNPLNLDDPSGSEVTRYSRVTGPDLAETRGAFQVVEPPALDGQVVRPMVGFLNYIHSNSTGWRSNATDGFRPIDPHSGFKPSPSIPLLEARFASTVGNQNRLETTTDNGWEPIKSGTDSTPRMNRRIVDGKTGKSSEKVPDSLNVVEKPRKPGKQTAGQSSGSKTEQKQKKSFEYEDYEYLGEPIFIEYYDEQSPIGRSDGTAKTTTTTNAPNVPGQSGKRSFEQGASKTVERQNTTERPLNASKSFVSGSPMAKPVGNVDKPIGPIEKPISTIGKPIGIIEKPISSVEKPTSSTVRPVSSTVSPVSSTARPVSSTVRPVSSTVKPVSSTMKPVSTTGKPLISSGTTRKLVVSSTRRPPVSSSTRKPAVSTVKIPTTTKGSDRPAVSSGAAKKLTLASYSEKPSSSTTKKPGFLPKKFSVSTTTRRPVSTTKAGAFSSSGGGTTKRFSVSTTRRPATTVHVTRRPFFNSTRALALKSRYLSGQQSIQAQSKLARTNSTKAP